MFEQIIAITLMNLRNIPARAGASSVIIVGALLAVGVPALGANSWIAKFFGFLAVIMAAVNIFGGFLVTRRMLEMFKAKKKPAAGGPR